MSRRPTTVTLVALTLVGIAIAVALVGFAATQLSGCCASSEPKDNRYAMAGLVLGALVVAAAIGLWLGAVSHWAILALTATLPLACLVASSRSSDLAGVTPFAIVAWALLAVFLRRPAPRRWLSQQKAAGAAAPRPDEWL